MDSVLLALLALAVACPCPGLAEAAPPLAPNQRIPRIDEPVEVDGLLNEPAWQRAWSMALKYEVSPGENIPARVRTEVLAFYDERGVNFAFRAYDPDPASIRAHLSDRDRIGPDDWVLMILDTFNDERRSFGFMVNPLGVQSDFVEAEHGGGGAWDAIWDSAAQITDWGYTVEIRIPFSSLRFQDSPGSQIWGVDAVRSYPRSADHRMGLFPRLRDNNCYLCQAVKLEGFEDVSPGLNLEIAPTLTAARDDIRSDWPSAGFSQGDLESEAGITARWGMTPNLTLAGTINPDFSQVEADALQMEINTRFALFVEEKRPFFMEGADFFKTQMNAIYTRTMIDPRWGTKLTGKEGANTIGAYVVRDAVTNFLFPGPEYSTAPEDLLDFENTAGVLRYKRDLGNRYTLGALATSRSGGDYSNQVYGVDGSFRLTDKDQIDAQFISSSTEYPLAMAQTHGQPEGRFSDHALDIFYAHRARYHSIWAALRDVGDGFRADLGFMPQVGLRYVVLGGSRNWLPSEGITSYTEMRTEVEGYRVENQQGDLLEEEASLTFQYQGPYQMHSLGKISLGHQGYGGQVFRRNEYFLHHCMKPTGHTFFRVNVKLGDAIDFTGGRQATRVRINPYISQNIGQHLRVELGYGVEQLDVDEGDLYTATIADATISYQFNARLFLRTTLQYVDYQYETELYPEGWDERYRTLLSQVLFSYKVNPQTVFFLGYSDSALGNEEVDLTRTSRRIFAKVGYAWTL